MSEENKTDPKQGPKGPPGPPGGPPPLLVSMVMRLMIGPVVKPTYADVSYIEVSEKYPASKDHTLNIYHPPNAGDGPFPLVVQIHGGAFANGDKELRSGEPELWGSLGRGYAVASLNYRLSGTALFPAAVKDCKAAIRFLRAEGGKYKLKTDRIGAWGGSAGGNLCAMLGTTAHVKELEDLEMGYADQSCHVDAVVDWFGPTDFVKMDDHMAEMGLKNWMEDHLDPRSPESRYLGVRDMRQHPDLVKLANPLTHVTTACPPFLIQHGVADRLVPAMQSIILHMRIREVCGADRSTLRLIQDAGHGDLAAIWKRFAAPANVAIATGFLDKHLRPASP